MNLKETALRHAVYKALLDIVKDEVECTKADMTEAFVESGATGTTATLADGTRVAKVSLTVGTPKVIVTDEFDLIAWLKENHPEHVVPAQTIEIPEGVNPMWLGGLKVVKGDEGVEVIDPDTGESIPLVGLQIRVPEPYPTVRFTDDGRRQIAHAWMRGDLGSILPQFGSPTPKALDE